MPETVRELSKSCAAFRTDAFPCRLNDDGQTVFAATKLPLVDTAAVGTFLRNGTQTTELAHHFTGSDCSASLVGAIRSSLASFDALTKAVPAAVSLAFCSNRPFLLPSGAIRPPDAARIFSRERTVALFNSGSTCDCISVAGWPANESTTDVPSCCIHSLESSERLVDAQVYRNCTLVLLISSGGALRLDMLKCASETLAAANSEGASAAPFATILAVQRGVLLLPSCTAAAPLACSVKRGLAAIFVEGSKGVFCDLEAENDEE